MGPELVGLKANEWTYKRGIYAYVQTTFCNSHTKMAQTLSLRVSLSSALPST